MKLGALRTQPLSLDISKSLNEIDELLSEAVKYTRHLTFELSLPILYEFGIVSALEWLGEQFYEKYDLQIRVIYDRHYIQMDVEIRVLIFKMVRELLYNVVKHAKASQVDIIVKKLDDCIFISVVDDGVGFVNENMEDSKKMMDLAYLVYVNDYSI